ncbi:class I SAM-dependent methyltransferase [Rhodoferax sp. 4810]|uniref:Class I SAM-dependent methyltransferase n=1 Tax=Thiospirillum jenense TaxID=1653858 RepID=A0A839H9U3_9GAMM|nr:class I SAM-dependent methyltransferase [Thiospirillum jenense]MBB1073507.1 class I SAM-dependent methyltransferase [Rhodoferax jenense]MBB1125995.1 class I SAM-dependent methyltransferase [Thiospirillum jenense]
MDTEKYNLVKDFWDSRAVLQNRAGTDDVLIKALEIEVLSSWIKDEMELLEFGCGNGVTAIELLKRKFVHIKGFDFSEKMIEHARLYAKNANMESRVQFAVADILDPPMLDEKFNIVYSERMLINLPNWEMQTVAINNMAHFLKPKGYLLLCENSQQGLEEINKLRVRVGLTEIIPPWHNIYLNDNNMESLNLGDCYLTKVVPYSATYYFISRVVNAWLAKQENRDPQYEDTINQLAFYLPLISECAQGKLWVFQKA